MSAQEQSQLGDARFVLDAHAVLAMLGKEPGGDVVQAICADAQNAIWISSVNLGEVYYILLRRRGEPAAARVEAALRQQANLRVVDATWERARGAAAVKAHGGLSFAHAFAVALARECSALLVTGDPEYRSWERSGEIRVLWLDGSPG